MGGSEIGIGQSGAPADHLDILAHIAQIVAKHFKGPGSDKGGNGGKKRNFAGGRQSGGKAHDLSLRSLRLKASRSDAH